MIGKIISMNGRYLEIELEEAFNQEYLKLLANGDDNFVKVIELDNRGISPQQNALSHALISDVAKWQGEEPYWSKQDLKHEYFKKNGGIWFEHSKATKSEAKEWISFLIDFVLKWSVPIPKIYRYLLQETAWFYHCLKYRKCCICLDQADVAHVDVVGMGRNRKKIDHSDFRFMALCRCHHSEEHTIGTDEFLNKYHITPLKLNTEDRKKLRIGG
ncbi:putative HNHc nuclease [Candidatus Enterococcus ferrettii]|uniref:Phage protein n=1 Tax=Candidatus Enterococcus ferrettii TaxID=2815324 RepID=A0ABV0EY18_9ENTE|nr:putative HNHc nuclease [Enterococcus sp. 665A]MBO1340344.1 hypothetical protein [Enterococcus sp. 665A]